MCLCCRKLLDRSRKCNLSSRQEKHNVFLLATPLRSQPEVQSQPCMTGQSHNLALPVKSMQSVISLVSQICFCHFFGNYCGRIRQPDSDRFRQLDSQLFLLLLQQLPQTARQPATQTASHHRQTRQTARQPDSQPDRQTDILSASQLNGQPDRQPDSQLLLLVLL